jgi:hypothetical protein
MDGVATMTKAYKFTFFRKSIFEERFVVEADTLEEAEEQMFSGAYPDPAGQEWLEWYDDEFGTDSEFPPEPQCPLYQMVKEHGEKEPA